MERVKRVVAAVMRSRPYRANERLGQARGNIVAAGIAFFGVFAIFPLLVLGVAVLGLVAGGNEAVQDRTIEIVAEAVPGLITPDGETDGGIVAESDLREAAADRFALGLSAVVGAVTLLLTGLGWIAAMREGTRAVFGLPVMALDPVRAKLFDLGVLVTLGLLIVLTSVVSVVSSSVGEQLLDVAGVDSGAASFLLRAIVVGVTLSADTLLFAVLYRVLANSRRPIRQLLSGALLAAVGVAVLRLLVGLVLGNVGRGLGFLTPFVPILTLFVWLNLNARVMLFGAAWAAVGRTAPVEASEEEEPAVPAPRPAPAPLPPALPVRWTDRAVLGAGVVLGGSAVALLQATGAALRAVTRGVGRLRED